MSSSGYLLLNQTALAGGAIPTATPINKNASYTQIGTCATARDSMMLPAYAPSGTSYKIRNDGVACCAIYAPILGQINNFGVNTSNPAPPNPNLGLASSAYLLAGNGGEVTFVSTGSLTYISTEANTTPLIIPVAVAHTVTQNENGALFAVTSAGANYLITLPPAPLVGQKFTFINSVTAATNSTSIGGVATANISGIIMKGPVGGILGLACAGVSSVNFATVSLVGDTIEMTCFVAGSWYVKAQSTIAVAITASA